MEADVTDAVAKKEIQLLLIGVKGIGGLEVSVVFDLSGSATATWSGNLCESIMFSPYTGITRVQEYKAESFFLELEATFKAGVRVSLGINDFPMDVIAGNVYVEAGAKGSVKKTNYVDDELPRSCVHTAIYLYLEYGATAHVKFGPFKAEASYKAKVWTDKNSPLRVVHHYEDGVEVAQCTRGVLDNNGYYTNSSSNYGSTGWSGGNNGYGVDANGNPVLLYTYAVDEEGNATITGYTGNSSSLSIPKTIDGYTVSAIGYNAFKNNASLQFVNLPNSVTAIGEEAFANCVSLRSITIPDSVTEIGRWAFSKCTNLQAIDLPKNISYLGYRSFGDCTSLTEIFIPKSLQTADSYGYNGGPFAGSGIKTAEIEQGMTTIPANLLRTAAELETVAIPGTVTKIGEYAFNGCQNLHNVQIPNNVIKIGNYAFASSGIVEIELHDTISDIGNYVFYDCSLLSSVALPSTMVSIPVGMFKNCISLPSIELPILVKSIQENAFSGCSELQTIIIPEKVTTIGNCAFYDCDSLLTVQIPHNVSLIGSQTFYDCDGITQIVIASSVTSIGKQAFMHCDSLEDVTLGTGIKTIPDQCFFECPALQKIDLPYRVTTIGNKAFANCTGLTEITILRNASTINTNAFSYPDRLTIYGVSGTYVETYAGEIGATFVAIDVPATNVSLNETNLRLAKGASFQLIPSITPINFTDATSWKSNNTSVATVTDDGLVKAVGIGEATISFVVGNKKATCSVTVVQPVTSISLNKTSLSMNAGETFQLVATVSPSNAENKEIEWSSSDETIASVDQTGLVTAFKKGTVTITATAKDGSGTYRTCAVTVTNNLFVVTSADGLQSPHPYEPNCCDIWQYSIPGAEGLSITFSTETSVEDGSDFIVIFTGDGTQVGMYTGTELSGQTIQVSGETVRIQLNSDGSYCEYGFAVTSVVPISYGHVHNYVAVVTPSTCTERGYTTHTCSVCGDSYVDAYTNALGHNYQNGVCTRCGTLNPNLENPFSDVKKSKYFYTPVLWAYYHNPRITGGTGDGKFSPNATCTREQIVTFLWKAYGAPEPQSYDNPFKDVKKSKYYYKAVLWAAEKGITSGVGNGKFGVGQGCTREQAMTFLWVAAGKPGHSQQESAFTDVKKGKYYYNAILWAVENGITSGVGNGKFGVGQTCTRAQIVTFLYALLGK